MTRTILKQSKPDVVADQIREEIRHSLFDGTARPWPDGTPRWKPRPMVAGQGDKVRS